MSSLLAVTNASNSKTYVDDVFSTYTYTGNGSTQTINNGIDLAGKGGLVWIKDRTTANASALVDTSRGTGYLLRSSTTSASLLNSDSLTGFNSNGFSLGSDTSSWGVNYPGDNYVSWTFRKAPKFFDVVTWTGNGAASRAISHSLGVAAGMIVVKRTDVASGYGWVTYHMSLAANNYMHLNTTGAAAPNGTLNYERGYVSACTTSTFTLSMGTTNSYDTNASGGTYVAYLFAHDASTDGLIQCGSYIGNGSGTAGPVINLGWEPQFLLIKASAGTSAASNNWQMLDVSRGMSQTATAVNLAANVASAETTVTTVLVPPGATGFQVNTTSTGYNESGTTYIYLAIRRPNKPPTTGTDVFLPYARTGISSTQTYSVGFAADSVWIKNRLDVGYLGYTFDRLRDRAHLSPNSTVAEDNTHAGTYAGMWNTISNSMTVGTGRTETGYAGGFYIDYLFKRAPGVFDVVCGTAVASAFSSQHSLGVAPELVILKPRSEADSWYVYHAGLDCRLQLQSNIAAVMNDTMWTVTSSTVALAAGFLGTSPTLVAYLFATKAGISKVGSYTGNGSSQTINCGFTTGARFVLIKRTDSTGDWFVWDTVRGIVASTDPHLSLNTTTAEVTTDDSIDPDTTGFVVNQVAATNVNVTSATYIYLAFA